MVIFNRTKSTDNKLKNALLEHVAGLRRYALLLTSNKTDADDLVQETLTRVLSKAKRWSSVNDMRAYMFTTMHNVFVDEARKRSRIKSPTPIDDVAAHLWSPAPQQKRVELKDMLVALGKLPVEQREVVLMVGVEGFSYTDCAATLNIPIGTVMSRLSRGRDTLRRLTSEKPSSRLRVVK